MADPKPYHLKNIDVENLDLSQHEKDFTPEELAAVKQALIATRNEHIANYEALPLLDKAGIYANEKFGQVGNYVEENPESLVLAPLAVIGAKAAVDKGRSIYGSLREKMSSGAAPTFAQELATDQAAINQNKPTTGPTPENPTVALNTEIGNPPKGNEIVKKAAENPEKNAVLKGRKEGVNPFAGATELRTGTGKPAFEGANPEGKIRSSYPDIKSVPKGYAFIPDARYIDVLRNDLGQAEYTKNLTGRPFPKEYSGPAGAVEVGKEINRSLGRETRAELLAKGIPENQLPKPTPGILEKTNAKGNKAVTVGGIVGAIAALPNLVHAAQGAGEKDVQKSYGSLVQGVGQFLGPLGAIGSELFGISPEELDTLRKAEKSRKQPVPPPR